MSAQQGISGGTIVIGIALLFNPATFAAGIGLIISGTLGLASSIIFRPKYDTPESAKAQELNLSTASAGFPIPIVFGKYKMTGNFMHLDPAQMDVTEVFGEAADGGKGGGSKPKAPVIGHDYSMVWEVGLCMGPIDGVGQVESNPGSTEMRNELGTKATGSLTADENWLAAENETITIGSVTYRFRSNPTSANDVWRGFLGGSIIALRAAINADEADKGLLYHSSTVQNPDVLAFKPQNNRVTDLDTMTVEARLSGTAGNSIVTTEAVSDTSVVWANGTMTGGSDSGEILDSFSGDYLDLSLSGNFDSGTARIYQGNSTQTRVSTGDPYQSLGMNYRNICWVLFGVSGGFLMGRQAIPKSYSFIIYRLPKPIRDDNTTVTGIKTRGSLTASHANYNSANPAAVIYESMTNKLWGAGLSSDDIDEASFITESVFFESRDIGVDFSVKEQDSLENFLDGIFTQLKSTIVWDGQTYKLKCLMNPATTHGTLNTVRKSEISDLEFSRADWTTTINEIRAEFVDELRGYRGNLAEVKDMGNIAQQGGRITTQRISLNVFTDYNTARRMAYRILQDSSYPLATIKFSINRFKSQLEIGDAIRFIWDEFNSASVTGYYVVTNRSGDDSGSEMIAIEAMEDINLPSVSGEELSVTVPDAQAWEHIDDLVLTQVGLAPDIPLEEAELYPIKPFEFPPIATTGARSNVVILAQKTSRSVSTIQYMARRVGKSLREVGTQASFAITASIKSDFTDLSRLNRTSAGFNFQLTNPTQDEATMLATYNKVADSSGDMEAVVAEDEDFLVVGEEMMQVGLVVKIATNHYRATNILRGLFDTKIKPYTVGEQLFFVPGAMHEGIQLGGKKNQEKRFRGYPVGSTGRVAVVGTDAFISHSGNYLATLAMDKRYMFWGLRPLPPVIKSVTDGGSTLTFTLRPRWNNKGAGMREGIFEDELLELQGNVDGMSFMYEQFDASLNSLERRNSFSIVSFTPDELNNPDAGVVVTNTITKATGVKRILIWSGTQKFASLDRVEYQV